MQAFKQGGKSSFLKQVMQLFDLKALQGEERGDLSLSVYLFFPEHADREAL